VTMKVCATPRAGATLLAAAALAMSFAAAAGVFPYRVLHRVALSGAAPVRALAFGPAGRHLYVAAGAELHSYHALSGEPGRVLMLPGVGVGLAAAAGGGGVLYVAIKSPARLLIIAPGPLRIRTSIALRDGAPSGLLYDSLGHALYVESRAGHSVVRLDPASGKPLAVAHLTGRLEQMAADGREMLYVANAAGHELEAIRTARMRPDGAIPLSGCMAPSGLAIDAVGRRLFVGCGNGQALIVDEDMGFTFVRLPIAPAARLRAAFAMQPLGPHGWKGAVFMAGDGPELDAIRMKAFISYVGGGALPLDGKCTALAVSPVSHRLALALLGRSSGASAAGAAVAGGGARLLILGGSGAGGSQ
jgi:hypothetical protein